MRKMNFHKLIIVVSLMCIMVCTFNPVVMAKTSKKTSYSPVIKQYINAVNNQQQITVSDLVPENMLKEYSLFLTNKGNQATHQGIFNIRTIDLVSATGYKNSSLFGDALEEDYAKYSDVEYWVVEWVLAVHENSEYFKNGLSRVLFVTGKENGAEKILDLILLPVQRYSFTAGNTLMSCDTPKKSDTPWTNPSSIKVLIVKEGKVRTVPFQQYCKVVATCEVGMSSWNTNALKACSLAIKNYGWRRTLSKKYPNLACDVKDGTTDQVYNPDKTLIPVCTDAVTAIWDYVMLDSNYGLFTGFHVKNSNVNSYARYHGGILSQVGSKTLADSGKTWQQIVHYYYDSGEYISDMGNGPIKIVNLKHTPVESGLYNANTTHHWRRCSICNCIHKKNTHTQPNTYKYDPIYHWKECSVCGHVLAKTSHSFVHYQNYSRCSVCGFITYVQPKGIRKSIKSLAD